VTTAEHPVTPATIAEWRRRKEADGGMPPDSHNGQGREPADGHNDQSANGHNDQSANGHNDQSVNGRGEQPCNGRGDQSVNDGSGQFANGHNGQFANGHNGQSANGHRGQSANGHGEHPRNGNGGPPPGEEAKIRNGFRVPAYSANVRSRQSSPAGPSEPGQPVFAGALDQDPALERQPGFAEAQQAGLTAIMRIAQTEPPRLLPTVKSIMSGRGPETVAPVRADSAGSTRNVQVSAPSAPAMDRSPVPPQPISAAPTSPSSTGRRQTPAPTTSRKRYSLSHLPTVLPLIAILTVQATLSARLIKGFTAFNDEALYIWAGRVEWSHWIHGTPVPLFQTYFSGAPVIYPPLGAIANDIGGLAGARILSLCFMLGATALLWGTASRLYNRWAAGFAAAFWAVLGPTQHLGAYATYDAMALFLVAVAAWCATGRREQEDATGWILAAAGALALANATKYASAIFDPVIIALAIASAWPRPGGKIALRRGTLLTACTTGALALMIRLGGPLYLRGIEQTTLSRTANTSPAITVLSQSWVWVGAVAVAAAVAVILCWRRPNILLTALLASAVLLVPIEQARIHTTTSLNKHVDFGAWFAAIAAGYAIQRIQAWPRSLVARVGCVCGSVICFFAACQAGTFQARNMLFGYWPNESRLIAALRPLTTGHGSFLSEGQYIPVYYLRNTSWQDWSNTRSVRTPGGGVISVPVGAEGDPAVYRTLISEHYFSVVLLTFTDTVTLDNDISKDLHSTRGYHIADIIPFGPTRHGNYTIWVYGPHFRHGSK
jgi:Dolichyl-phosphate-mannose-protein mannosyltransferase